jgi:hypothetical protein
MVIAATVSLALASPSRAVIQRDYPLADILSSSNAVWCARVVGAPLGDPAVVLQSYRSLKAKAPAARASVRLAADRSEQNGQLKARLPVGARLVIFSSDTPKGPMALAYCEGTWFRLGTGKPGAGWQFVHFEPYLRRSYRGSSAGLADLISRAAGKGGPLPAPDPRQKPGLGPVPDPRGPLSPPAGKPVFPPDPRPQDRRRLRLGGRDPGARLDPGIVAELPERFRHIDPGIFARVPSWALKADPRIFWPQNPSMPGLRKPASRDGGSSPS